MHTRRPGAFGRERSSRSPRWSWWRPGSQFLPQTPCCHSSPFLSPHMPGGGVRSFCFFHLILGQILYRRSTIAWQNMQLLQTGKISMNCWGFSSQMSKKITRNRWKETDWKLPNIARGTTHPGYWVWYLRMYLQLKFNSAKKIQVTDSIPWIDTLPWIALMALSVSIELVSLLTRVILDPGIPRSDKNPHKLDTNTSKWNMQVQSSELRIICCSC